MGPTAHLNQLTAPALLDVEVIREEVRKDPALHEIFLLIEEQGVEIPHYTCHQGILKFKGRLVLSKTSTLIPTIMHTYHDSVFGGHSRFLRTYKRMAGELYWKGMKKDIQKYCEECMICQKNKSSTLSPAGLLLPLEIPDAIWNDISMDFIEGLPKSHGWEVILSSSYHPQTDRQTEVVNKNVEAYLRCFCGEKPREWSQWLHWAEYWYNTTYHGSIGISPFQAVYGRLPPPLIQYGDMETPNSTLDQQLRDRDIILRALKEHLRVA
ncbi:ty3-gypsy retrotransposon protein [Cucumis melo var. makuwa]|uniref:Ty3-gypsy retrotransposon protein n=1 Tax=Cucumis melo var. makuwa TaxID=1194695 RepID=A0A5A7TCC9_CUCMM|nr:ty3-gypsy retrotransposon protein [Cucumis melo var. makuwa]